MAEKKRLSNCSPFTTVLCHSYYRLTNSGKNIRYKTIVLTYNESCEAPK